MTRFKKLLTSVINARYSVSSWLWVIVSTVTAAIMLMYMLDGTQAGLNAFLAALPLNGVAWAGGLVLTGLVKMFGMARHRRKPVAIGSFVAFCLWVFGALSFIIIGNAATVIILILPIMIFNAYLFLGVALREGPGA